jgi:NADPH2:quinone reductase
MLAAEKRPEKQRVKARTGKGPRTIPETMLAEAIDRFGPPQVLRPHTLPVPKLGSTEILVELHAAGVGIWDAKIRDGTWAPEEVEFPLVLGSDGAGIVVAKGSRVRRFDIGDRVWAYEYMNPKGGFYAEYIVLDTEHVGIVPRPLDLMHAGTAVVTALTAQQGIDEHLDVRRDERVLIFGASGAVGSYAVQVAKFRGAYVIGTATGADAQSFVGRLGADAVIDARHPRGLARLAQLAPHDLDAVLALSGGEALEHCMDHVRPGGRVAYPDGVEPPPKRRPKVDVSAYDAVGARASSIGSGASSSMRTSGS